APQRRGSSAPLRSTFLIPARLLLIQQRLVAAGRRLLLLLLALLGLVLLEAVGAALEEIGGLPLLLRLEGLALLGREIVAVALEALLAVGGRLALPCRLAVALCLAAALCLQLPVLLVLRRLALGQARPALIVGIAEAHGVLALAGRPLAA